MNWKMQSESYDMTVIGGGIIVSALAGKLSKRFRRVFLLEKAWSIGCHASGRNSGVVHSGFNPMDGTRGSQRVVECHRA